MQKKEIAHRVAKMTGLTDYDAEQAINATLKVLEKCLINDERVEFRGFGVFKPVVRAEKKARDIHKDQIIMIPEHKTIKFAVSDTLKRKLNGR